VTSWNVIPTEGSLWEDRIWLSDLEGIFFRSRGCNSPITSRLRSAYQGYARRNSQARFPWDTGVCFTGKEGCRPNGLPLRCAFDTVCLPIADRTEKKTRGPSAGWWQTILPGERCPPGWVYQGSSRRGIQDASRSSTGRDGGPVESGTRSLTNDTLPPVADHLRGLSWVIGCRCPKWSSSF